MSGAGGEADIAVFVYESKTNQRVSAEPTHVHIGAVECGGMLGFICKVRNSSLTLEVRDSSMGFIQPLALQLQWLAYVT